MHPLLGQVVAAIVGAAVALIVVLLTHRTTLARSVRERRLNKLEDLLNEVLKFSQQSQRLYDLTLDVEASSDPFEFDSRLRELREARLETHARIRLLSAIYFPDLQTVLDGVWQSIVHMDKQVLRAGSTPTFSAGELKSTFESTRSTAIRMRQMCIQEANRLLGQKALRPPDES